jgi:3-dehydroquinate synthase
MQPIVQRFQVTFQYPVHFTNGLFRLENPLLADVIRQDGNLSARKVYFIIDSSVAAHHPHLLAEIKAYVAAYSSLLTLCADPVIMPGGEACKNDPALVEQIQRAVNDYGIDRHSYIAVVGGGALIDMAGFAAAVSHRGVRLIRIPTTVLAQNDSGVGVKNSVNAFHKKNFLGTFAPPFAVLNDFNFLTTLDDRDWRAGISEAIKVALIKDATFFERIRQDAPALAARDMAAMQYLIYRCAQMHLDHIAGGDPFEMGSSRPLDFGHWSAHKLEALTNYQVRHGEAVAVGIALDCIYANLVSMLSGAELDVILDVLETIGFSLYAPELSTHNDAGELAVVQGLREFQEHLGGRLTIMLLEKIGKGVEVHEVNPQLVAQAVERLKKYSLKTA